MGNLCDLGYILVEKHPNNFEFQLYSSMCNIKPRIETFSLEVLNKFVFILTSYYIDQRNIPFLPNVEK